MARNGWAFFVGRIFIKAHPEEAEGRLEGWPSRNELSLTAILRDAT